MHPDWQTCCVSPLDCHLIALSRILQSSLFPLLWWQAAGHTVDAAGKSQPLREDEEVNRGPSWSTLGESETEFFDMLRRFEFSQHHPAFLPDSMTLHHTLPRSLRSSRKNPLSSPFSSFHTGFRPALPRSFWGTGLPPPVQLHSPRVGLLFCAMPFPVLLQMLTHSDLCSVSRFSFNLMMPSNSHGHSLHETSL